MANIWFGNLRKAGWVPAPNSGMEAGYEGTIAGENLVNGGAFARRSPATHRVYNMEWKVQTIDAMEWLNLYRSGVYGSGLMYFVDPFVDNALPPHWARPELTTMGWPSLVGSDAAPVAAPAALVTNYATNPNAVTTSGVVTVRTNKATDPRGTVTNTPPASSGLGIFRRWFGTTGNGTAAYLTGRTDGPVVAPEAFQRVTWTVANTTGSGEIGFNHSNGASSNTGLAETTGYPVVAGDNIAVSLWVRKNMASNLVMHTRLIFRNAAGTFVSSFLGDAVTLVNNQWTLVSGVTTVPVGATLAGIGTWSDSGGVNVAIGDTLDATALLVENSTIVSPYFDGTVVNKYRYNMAMNPRAVVGGTANWNPNNSTLHLRAAVNSFPVAHPQGITTGVAYNIKPGQVSPAALSAYNIDGLLNTAPNDRALGFWVMTMAGGYQAITTTGFTLSAPVPLVPGVWTFVKSTSTQAAGTYSGAGVSKVSGNADAADIIYATGVLAEIGVPQVGDYFDGSTANGNNFVTAWARPATPNASESYFNDTDTTVAWSGTVNNSTSLVRGVLVVGANMGNGAGYQSAALPGKSIRLTPTSVASSTLIIGALAAGNMTTLIPGKTYTIIATRTLFAPLTGVVSTAYTGRAAMVVVGGTSAATYSSDQILPNVAGTSTLRWTFTVPMDATSVTLRLGHGGAEGSGDVWWSDIAVVDGPYAGPQFDGATRFIDGRTAAWTGTANASTSTLAFSSGAGPSGSALYTIQNPLAGNYKRACVLLIPDGYQLNVGFCGTAANGGAVVVQPINTDGTYAPVQTLTLLDPTGNYRINTVFRGDIYDAVIIYLENTTPGAATVTLNSGKAVYTTLGTAAESSGVHAEGHGHSGLQFSSDPSQGYISMRSSDNARLVSTSIGFKEMGAWM